MLTIAIPTYQRSEKLEILLHCIAQQIQEVTDTVKILVRDDLSGDDTVAMVEAFMAEYPGICQLVIAPERFEDGGATNFVELYQLPETEWTWMMGDDDLLLPGALRSVLELIKKGTFSFLHLTEESRSRKANALYTGDFLELCNGIGLLELTGFMSCNVVKTSFLAAGMRSKNIHLYREAAFVHSFALLETMVHEKAAIYDMPLVKTQSPTMTDETKQIWKKYGIPMKYNRIVDCLEALIDDGIIDQPLTAMFFRYHRTSLVGRLLYTFYTEVYNGDPIAESDWYRLYRLVSLMPEEEAHLAMTAIASARVYIEGIYALTTEYRDIITAYNFALDSFNQLLVSEPATADRYTFTYL